MGMGMGIGIGMGMGMHTRVYIYICTGGGASLCVCGCVQAKVRFTGFEESWDTLMPHGSDKMFPARQLSVHSLAVLLGSLLPLRHVCPLPF